MLAVDHGIHVWQDDTQGITDFFKRSVTKAPSAKPTPQSSAIKTKRHTARALGDQKKSILKLAKKARALENDYNLGEALSLYSKVLSSYVKILGPNHPLTVEIEDDIHLCKLKISKIDARNEKMQEESDEDDAGNTSESDNENGDSDEDDAGSTSESDNENDDEERPTEIMRDTQRLNAAVAFDNGRYDEALEEYQKLLSIDKKMGRLFRVTETKCKIAVLLMRKGDYNVAMKMYEDTLPFLEDDLYRFRAHLDMARALKDVGNFEEAAQMYQRAIDSKLEAYNHVDIGTQSFVVADTYFEFAMMVEDTGQLEKALELFKRFLTCLELTPDNLQPVLVHKKFFENARSAIDRVEKKIAEKAKKARRKENFFAVTSAKKSNALPHLPQEMWESIFKMNRPGKN